MARGDEAMHTLLLRLAGPMQSWGTQSRFLERDTGLEPSKSGVIGLLCAARGIRRDEPVGELAALVMGVRVDREGAPQRDYQTALNVVKAGNAKETGTVISNRYCLADADFLVGLESPNLALLQRLDAALESPHWPLFLGRKSYLPAVPLRLPGGGVREGQELRQTLCAEPWRPRAGDPAWKRPPQRLRVVLEVTPELSSARRTDQPGPGAAFQHRRFLPRNVVIEFWETGDEPGKVPLGEASDV